MNYRQTVDAAVPNYQAVEGEEGNQQQHIVENQRKVFVLHSIKDGRERLNLIQLFNDL